MNESSREIISGRRTPTGGLGVSFLSVIAVLLVYKHVNTRYSIISGLG